MFGSMFGSMFGLMFGSLSTEVLKARGKMLFALLALLGASVASAEPPRLTSAAARHVVPATPNQSTNIISGGVWRLQQPAALPGYTVLLSRNISQPQYRIQTPNGETIDLPQLTGLSFKGLSRSDVELALEDSRVILQSAVEVLASKQDFAYAVVQDHYIQSIQLDPSFYRKNHVRPFDALSEFLQESPLGAKETAFVDASLTAGDQQELPKTKRTSARDRFISVVQFLNKSIVLASINAFKAHRQGHIDLRTHVQEWGFQIALRGEIQVGIGKINVTKNFPLMLSFGYNREKRRVVFRKGIRVESMSEGTAFSIGLKAEFRFYRLWADKADGNDAREGHAIVTGGRSWNPPNPLPFPPFSFVSAVLDTAPGYQSLGFSVGINVADAVPGTAGMSTSINFEEQQRVYSAPLPDPIAAIRQLQEQMNAAGAMFGDSKLRVYSCQELFKPTLF